MPCLETPFTLAMLAFVWLETPSWSVRVGASLVLLLYVFQVHLLLYSVYIEPSDLMIELFTFIYDCCSCLLIRFVPRQSFFVVKSSHSYR